MSTLIVFIVVAVGFGLLVMYNAKVLFLLSQSTTFVEKLYLRFFGTRIRNLNLRMERETGLRKKSLTARGTRYLREIIQNLDMQKDGVTPAGLLVFLTAVSLAGAALVLFFAKNLVLAFLAFFTVFYLVLTLLRFISLLRYERKEAEIMDTVDLLAMDVRGGVKNAIQRYTPAMHPNIKPYFEEFLDNINIRGYSFEQAMLLLSDRLGPNFVDFAQKAILYEAKADNELEDIFSSIIEVNRHRRELRYRTNMKFSQLRFDFLTSGSVILGYAVFSIWLDGYIRHFLTSTVGMLMIIIDVFVVTLVLSYMAAIKAKL